MTTMPPTQTTVPSTCRNRNSAYSRIVRASGN